MASIHIDILFAVNTLPDAALLCATGYLSGAAVRFRRIFPAALIGGLAATASAFMSGPFSRIPLLAASALGMSAIAFGTDTTAVCILRACLLYAVSCTHAGAVSAFSGFSGATRILPFAAILFGAAAVMLFASLFRSVVSDVRQKNLLHSVHIVCGEKCADLPVLSDTGHTLRSPLTNHPVLIVTLDSLSPLIPTAMLPEIERNRADAPALLQLFQEIGFHSLTLIPYHAVGISGLLCAFLPDSIQCDGNPTDMMVAVTDTMLSESGTYSGLMGTVTISGGV